MRAFDFTLTKVPFIFSLKCHLVLEFCSFWEKIVAQEISGSNLVLNGPCCSPALGISEILTFSRNSSFFRSRILFFRRKSTSKLFFYCLEVFLQEESLSLELGQCQRKITVVYTFSEKVTPHPVPTNSGRPIRKCPRPGFQFALLQSQNWLFSIFTRKKRRSDMFFEIFCAPFGPGCGIGRSSWKRKVHVRKLKSTACTVNLRLVSYQFSFNLNLKLTICKKIAKKSIFLSEFSYQTEIFDRIQNRRQIGVRSSRHFTADDTYGRKEKWKRLRFFWV